jgi:hypothetical protein
MKKNQTTLAMINFDEQLSFENMQELKGGLEDKRNRPGSNAGKRYGRTINCQQDSSSRRCYHLD